MELLLLQNKKRIAEYKYLCVSEELSFTDAMIIVQVVERKKSEEVL